MKTIADGIAAIVVLSLVLYVGLLMTGIFGASASAVGGAWFGLYAFIVLMSATKLYGKKIYTAVKSAGSGFLKMQNGGT